MTTEPRAVTADDGLLTLVEMLRLHGRVDTEEANALERAHLAALSAPHPDPEPREALREALDRALGSLAEEDIRQEWEPGSTHEGGPTLFVQWDALIAALRVEPSSIDVERPYDATRMTHAWAILTAVTREPMPWEPDRYNAAAFVTALLAEYARLTQEATRAERTENEHR